MFTVKTVERKLKKRVNVEIRDKIYCLSNQIVNIESIEISRTLRSAKDRNLK